MATKYLGLIRGVLGKWTCHAVCKFVLNTWNILTDYIASEINGIKIWIIRRKEHHTK